MGITPLLITCGAYCATGGHGIYYVRAALKARGCSRDRSSHGTLYPGQRISQISFSHDYIEVILYSGSSGILVSLLTRSYTLVILLLGKHFCYLIVTKCRSRIPFNRKPQAISGYSSTALNRNAKNQTRWTHCLISSRDRIYFNPGAIPPSVYNLTLTNIHRMQAPHRHIIPLNLGITKLRKVYNFSLR